MPTSLITAVVEDNGGLETSSSLCVPWWSFTKTVIATAALVLVDRRRLELDTALPGKPFTLRQLLQHRSGLPDYGSVSAYHSAVAAAAEPWPVTEMLDRSSAGDLLFEPGEQFSYSNIGYVLVRHLIEDATSTSLDAALRELVFEPLAITGASVPGLPADLDAIAWGNSGRYHPGWVHHGLAVGPVADAAMFLHHLLDGALLPAALHEAMRSMQPVCGPMQGRPWRSVRYGLGLAECRTASGSYLGHSGEGPGSTAAVLRLVHDGKPGQPWRTAAAFAACNDPGLVEREAVRLLSQDFAAR